MVAPVKITGFSGMMPSLDDRQLPANAAAYSENVVLGDGTLRGFRPSAEIRTLTNGAALRVFRIPNDPLVKPTSTFLGSTWMEFTDENTDVLSTPVINDEFSRFYWASPSTEPRYNSLTRIQAGQQSYKLGVPQPSAPSVVAAGGSSDLTTTRAYVYTWVTSFNEEGPPSQPFVITGKVDDIYTVTVTEPTGGQSTDRSLEAVRLYRTVTSDSGVATYFLVDNFLIDETEYEDGVSEALVSSSSILESTTWVAPPSTLEGIIAMPNGFFAGWTGSDVYFSEPFRPHAWPAEYSLSVDSPIVGLGVVGQSLVVATKGHPTIISGIHPSQMSQQKLEILEPCLSRASIISSPKGVVYASHNGLVKADPGGVENLTAGLVDREMWLSEVDPYDLMAVRHGTSYMAVHAPRDAAGAGIFIDRDPTRFNWLEDTAAIKSLTADVWTGEIFAVHTGKVWHVDPQVTTGMNPYLWRSKVFEIGRPENLGAAKITFTVPAGAPALNPTPNTDLVQTLAADQYGLFRVYADGALKYTRELRTSGQVFGLASGFKATTWQFEIEARVIVNSIEVAHTKRQLRDV